MKAEEFIELAHSSFNITNAEERLLQYMVKDYAIKDEILKFHEKESRIIQATLIRWIFTNPEVRSFVDPYGLRIEGAEIKGDLNLDSITIPFPLVLKGCCFKGNIILTDAETCFLSLEGSTCNSITAKRIKVKGSLRLDRLEAKQGVDFCGADISGDFDCRKGRFIKEGDKAFWAEHAQVGGNLFLIDSLVMGETNLSGAKIKGNLDCSDGGFINLETDNSSSQNEVHALDTSLAEVDGKVCFKNFRVTGHVFALEMKVGGDFDCTGGFIKHKTGNCHAISIDRSSIYGNVVLGQKFSAVGQVRLIATKIGSDLDCSGGTFYFSSKNNNVTLDASRATVGGSVFLCESRREIENYPVTDFKTNGLITLELANINHSIMVGTDFGGKTSIFMNDGEINLSSAKIKDSLRWFRVRLTEKTKLNLCNAKISHLITDGMDEEKRWPKFGNLFLDGFIYDAINHSPNSSKTTYTTHLKWLERQSDFNPQNYEQLATALRRSGQDADAKKVSIEKEKIRRKPEGSCLNPFNWLRCLWSLILYITVGYGYETYKALIWSVIVILFGWLIFWKGYNDGIMVPTNEEAFKTFTKYYTKHYDQVPHWANYYAEHHEEPPEDVKQLLYYTEFEPFIYSLDAFFSIVNLHQQEKWQPYDHKEIEIPIPLYGNKVSFTLRHYLYFVHIPLGWVLITLGIAGLTGLIRKN